MDPILLFAGLAVVAVFGIGIFAYLSQGEQEKTKPKIILDSKDLKKETPKMKKKSSVSKKTPSKIETAKREVVQENPVKDSNEKKVEKEKPQSKPTKNQVVEKKKESNKKVQEKNNEKKNEKDKTSKTNEKKNQKKAPVFPEPSKEDMELLNWQKDALAHEEVEEEPEPKVTPEWKVVKKSDETEGMKKKIAELEKALEDEKKKNVKLSRQIENMKDFHKKQLKDKFHKESELQKTIAKMRSQIKSDKLNNRGKKGSGVWNNAQSTPNGNHVGSTNNDDQKNLEEKHEQPTEIEEPVEEKSIQIPGSGVVDTFLITLHQESHIQIEEHSHLLYDKV